jgi:hypothetical protein
MNFVQGFLTAVFPKAWGELMRADSERWKYCCSTSGHSRSMWDAGEVCWNWNPQGRRLVKWCPACRRPRWSVLEYHAEKAPAAVPDSTLVSREKVGT